jgi:MarR-like DNA-binding transcriptional regulator SgrR of sgrS sRNA
MALSYERAAYLKRVATSELSPAVKAFLLLLSTHYADATGYHSGASTAELTQMCNVSSRHLRRMIAQAKLGGWLQAENGGGRSVNAYQLTLPLAS